MYPCPYFLTRAKEQTGQLSGCLERCSVNDRTTGDKVRFRVFVHHFIVLKPLVFVNVECFFETPATIDEWRIVYSFASVSI